MEQKKKPGKPKKGRILGERTLRFREEYLGLNEQLKYLAQSSENSMNDYLLKVLQDHVELYHPLKRKTLDELELEYKILFEKIDDVVSLLETKIQTNLATEHILFKTYINVNFPTPLKRRLIYFKLIKNQIRAERELLTILFTIGNRHLDCAEKDILSYTDFLLEKKDNSYKNRESIYWMFLEKFLHAWSLQLNLIGVSNSFDLIDFKTLENFIFSRLYPNLRSTPLMDKKKYNELKEKWRFLINQVVANGFEGKRVLNGSNLDYYITFLKMLIDAFKSGDSLLSDFPNPQSMQDKNQKILDDFEGLLKDITSNFLTLSIYKQDLPKNKDEFLWFMRIIFNAIFYQIKENETIKDEFHRVKEQFFLFMFKPFILENLIDFESFYSYLKEKGIFETFMIRLID